MNHFVVALCGVACFCFCVVAAEKQTYNQTQCDELCVGDRDKECRESVDKDGDEVFVCMCDSGYFTESERESGCKDECGERFTTLFTYGTCTDSVSEDGLCNHLCGWRLQIWTTIGLFIICAAAVLILVTLLPMCCATCKACFLIQKDRKRTKIENIRKSDAMSSMTMSKPQGQMQMGTGTMGPQGITHKLRHACLENLASLVRAGGGGGNF